MTNRPRKIFWAPCQCGSPACKRMYPTNLGVFYQGTGFRPHEVEWLNEAWDALNAAEDEFAHDDEIEEAARERDIYTDGQ